MILEAEKFRANLPGKFQLNSEHQIGNKETLMGHTVVNSGEIDGNKGIFDIGRGVSDDDFFHLTCHIEPSLIHKIEKGEFVELEKLLPKDKFGKPDEGRMEWVHRDGGVLFWCLHNKIPKSVVSVDGNRHSEPMQLYIVALIHIDQRKSGNI